MKIKITKKEQKNNKAECKFQHINVGAIFIYNESLYIKTCDSFRCHNVINIQTQCSAMFYENQVVERLESIEINYTPMYA